MGKTLIYLLQHLAKESNIIMDMDEARVQLLSHPYYPSINSVTDLFNHFSIDNLAMRVDNNLETLSQIPNTFLAQVKEESGNQLVIVSKNKDDVELIYDKNKSKNLGVATFLKLWTGIILIIEKSEKVKLPESTKISRVKNLVAFTAFVVFGFIFLYVKPSIFQIIHFALSGIGLYISYLIVQHELGLHSKILDKFCSGQSKKTNCDAVLSSKGATIFGLFKLSDVGLVYFASLVVGWLFLAINGFQSVLVIFMLSTLTVPFTFLSIYYQWRVVKSWCPLCLTVVSILWLQFGALFLETTLLKNVIVVDSSYLIFIASLLVVTSLWIFIQSLLKKEQQFQKLEIEYIKFKRNFTLFKAALNLNPLLDTTIPFTKEIIFGNKEALLKLVIVTNPMCGYCKESHKLIENILKNENIDVQITIRFNVRPEDEESKGTKIAAKIIELYHTTDKNNCLYALSDIYGEMDAKTWLEKWGGDINKDYVETLKKEKEWCTNNKINFTPAILINGKQYPKEYDRMDFLYFIDDLIEEQKDLVNIQSQMVNS
ncbi:vitamin K epoxide reductase family protein [Lutibacter sp.]|uniref:vitamin K epoxide reductase family protein n=1 Tax=Lutibacter sp. TaxID=1925666 RepID=UPI0025BA257A|nr:vitamin K epoxide reductase family protein [Lutibacter sp.]MCF6168854.1 thioredoxin domain-containing protein [Lutibacter sp.]